ncbi:MAG: ABC transporter ATP-binding protein [Bacilli bacterium]
MAVIEVDNVHKEIKGNKVLKGVHLKAQGSEVVGIVGDNGSGKTTLLRILCGLVPATEGSVRILGEPLTPAGPIPQGIAVVFDPPALLPDMAGLQNMIVISKIRDLMTRDELRGLMMKVGLNPDDKRKVSKYSQGMKKRLALAISMMESPRLVLMDEPTNGLDPRGISELRTWIAEFASSGACVVIVGHYMQEMSAVCDTVYRVDDGTLVQIGTDALIM